MLNGRTFVLMLLPLTLMGCPSDARFEVRQQANRTIIELVPADSSVCPDMLGINDATTMQPMWQISSTSKCSRRFVYGVIPGGFQQQLAAAPLVKGRDYIATASAVQPSTFTVR